MAKVFIGLGGNLSDPVAELRQAVETMNQLETTKVISCSQFYASAPLGPEDQPDFINAVCELETSLPPHVLLLALQAIELEQGRIKKRHWGERIIDLDILLYDDQIIMTEDLIIPHAEIANRDFVLIPLAEIAPSLSIPHKGNIEGLIANLSKTYLKPIA
ncbi:MAG: 2-amino-4-hydroxy-6-hydroxymethyldihydropteridine diphosphokinase [Thiomicrorhabdus sp.]|nr:MAG: 2-amino-4-hydroxy-6-hydroxymethyldihydropteridine diphosphokinase [Thiomicrorhabdus sp.]